MFSYKYFTLLKHKENNSKEQRVNSENGSYSADQYSPYIQWRNYLRQCATRREVRGSVPVQSLGILKRSVPSVHI